MKKISSFCLTAIATLAITNQLALALELQIVSPNAYKVPYLGFDGVFNLNTQQEQSVKDPRNPKQIAIEKMEKFTFYKDTAGTAIARNCRYVYMGAAPDPKYYSESKTAVWELFELVPNEKQDKACDRFKYMILTAPHGESSGEPIHMHFRYSGEQSSLAALLKMSNVPKNAANFSPWFATYCGGGKTNCGTSE
ncbi:hypothetical protein H6G17_07405 [Chroococcidiopsis sp. FACHB-1243]|uniref:hypothetical protein n=1 Tax=Chroococcidiopsis sp. [FACHB-1243] TaxID=2692781 RepID=UPI0017822C53|nr:hypothetical protein [Chroococcidiopsis sp. [FACHB-1243]]MBD2305338.1 hypothetical protein [Chroococcidiopsis sp. [FACHB-1243]]